MVISVSLWKFGFYCDFYVWYEWVGRNLNHFIVYLFMQICVVFAVHDGEVLCLGVHDLQQR